MPSYKSVWSSVAYHTATAPAIRFINKTLKKQTKRLKRRIDAYQRLSKRKNTVRTPQTPAPVRRPATPLPVRRPQAAPRPTPKVSPKITPNKAAPAPHKPVAASKSSTKLTRRKPPGSVREAIRASKTHGELRRRLTGLAVREFSGRFSGSRSDRAGQIKAIRKVIQPKNSQISLRGGSGSKFGVLRTNKAKALKRAASIISRSKKKT